MKEVGIDISGQTSKHLDQFLNAGINTVVTECGGAAQACPSFPGRVDRFHWGFEDPPLAVRGGEAEIETHRRIRDEIGKVFNAHAAGYLQALAANDRLSNPRFST